MLTEDNTPAEHAAEALRCIEASPETFDMDCWIRTESDDDLALLPEEDPASCGTTLCMGGWVVHNAGYTIDSGGIAMDRDGGMHEIATLASTMLGLDIGGSHFFSDEHEAIELLRSIAEGRR